MSSSPLRKVSPTAGESVQADLAAGSLLRSDGVRCAALSIDFVQSLHFSLLEQFGDLAQDVLYRCGYEWGLQDMLQLNQRLREESDGKSDIWQLDAQSVFDSWWTPFQESGWGLANFDISRMSRGIVVTELQNSVVAAAVEGEQPACHFYAGLFGGGVSFFDRAERHATEIECRGAGHPTCRFVIGPGTDVDAAESARQQGTSPMDIIRRLG
jgi:predicted hydrocarbon binding protein